MAQLIVLSVGTAAVGFVAYRHRRPDRRQPGRARASALGRRARSAVGAGAGSGRPAAGAIAGRRGGGRGRRRPRAAGARPRRGVAGSAGAPPRRRRLGRRRAGGRRRAALVADRKRVPRPGAGRSLWTLPPPLASAGRAADGVIDQTMTTDADPRRLRASAYALRADVAADSAGASGSARPSAGGRSARGRFTRAAGRLLGDPAPSVAAVRGVTGELSDATTRAPSPRRCSATGSGRSWRSPSATRTPPTCSSTATRSGCRLGDERLRCSATPTSPA